MSSLSSWGCGSQIPVRLGRGKHTLHSDELTVCYKHLQGPSPLLLSAVTSDDLAVLLSWSDKSTSQVEFGAHQVVLTRSMESIRRDRFPEALQNVNALFLTVPQVGMSNNLHGAAF